MCGIAGRFNFRTQAPVDPAVLGRMADLLAHRGPDGAGVHTDGAIGLAHRRLAVIDPTSAGHQPMQAFGSWVTYNGEIYNYRELRTELATHGFQFRTNSDTEVILAAYRHWGAACLTRLMGMFAFVIWDAQERTLFAARDRLGQKPLAYRLDANGLAFASEVKAFLAEPEFVVQPDFHSIAQYLALLYVPGSAFANVKRLPPGHYLEVRDGQLTTQRYWHLRFEPKLRLDDREAAEQLERHLHTAVKRRLISDVPLGAFLSGGLDSTAVVALMTRHSATQVKTFSIGFAEPRYDELRFARDAAQHLGTDHHEFVVEPDAVELLPSLTWHYDEPFADSSAIPTMYLSRLTRQSVTVALTGDASDEAFGGYDRYRAMCAADRLASLPGWARRTATAVAAALPRPPGWPRLTRTARFLAAAFEPQASRYASWMTHVTSRHCPGLFTPAFIEQAGAFDDARFFEERFAESAATHTLDRTIDVDVRTYLPGDLLVKMDIASMAFGLEARSPFLDHELVEFAAALPPSQKLRGRRAKHLLREVVQPLVPPTILERRKQGFGVPLDEWFRHDLRDFVRDVLGSSRARARGYFNAAAVTRLIDDHQSGRRDRHHQLWALIMCELWHQQFVDDQPRR